MYQKKRNERFFQNFVLIGICALVLLGGCSPIPYPASAPMSPISPLSTNNEDDLNRQVVNGLDYSPNVNDMANLLSLAEPFACEHDDEAVLHCAMNAVPFGTEKFPARIYIKVPPQKAYPDVGVVLLPVLPPLTIGEGEKIISEFPINKIEDIFNSGERLNIPDPGTGFIPNQLITNLAIVEVDPDTGEFDPEIHTELSEFDPAIEVRLEFNRQQLQRAADADLGMPRFGYWSYEPLPEDRKWVEFTPERENDNRALLEIFKADKAITPAERSMADVGILEFIEEAATVDEALELLKQPSTRGTEETAIRAIVIRDPTGLADKFDQFSNAFTRGIGDDAETRVSFVVTVSKWEDQTLALFP